MIKKRSELKKNFISFIEIYKKFQEENEITEGMLFIIISNLTNFRWKNSNYSAIQVLRLKFSKKS